MQLQYGSLEGPELGVYIRGRLTNSNIITLPDYWTGLVRSETITVSLTSIGKSSLHWIDYIEDNQIRIDCADSVDCFYVVFGERKDVDQLKVEF